MSGRSRPALFERAPGFRPLQLGSSKRRGATDGGSDTTMALLIQLNNYGTHAQVLPPSGPDLDASPPGGFRLQPGESLWGIEYEVWARHVGDVVDILELQASAQALRNRQRRAVTTHVRLRGGHWLSEPPIEHVAVPRASYGFSTGVRAVPCSREQLIRQCVEAPDTPAVWTPEDGGLVRPEQVPFLVGAMRQRRLDRAETQRTVAGALLAALAAMAWIAGAGPRSGWVVLCALAAAWFAITVINVRAAARETGSAFGQARQAHRHAVWLEGHPPLLTWGLIALIVLVMVGQIVSAGDPIAQAGLVKPRVHAGEWWRLLTGAFLHGGPLHLGLNVLAIWSLGPLVEAHSGRHVLPILFGTSAIAGSLASVWLIPDAPSVGASGGILGMVGYLFVLGYRRRQALPQGYAGRMGLGILATAVFGIVGYGLVDNAMHLGGLLAGMGLAMVPTLQGGASDGRSSGGAVLAGRLFGVALIAAAVGSLLLIL